MRISGGETPLTSLRPPLGQGPQGKLPSFQVLRTDVARVVSVMAPNCAHKQITIKNYRRLAFAHDLSKVLRQWDRHR